MWQPFATQPDEWAYGPDGIVTPDGALWPYCSVPGCEFVVCTWASDDMCYRHTEEVFGEDHIKAAYEATHEMSWEEFQRDEE